MKKSKYCKLIPEDGKVVKYQRELGIVQEYYRCTPELCILEILNHHNFNIPKVLDKNSDYFIEEFIEGELFDSIYEDYSTMNKSDINSIIKNIVRLSVIDYKNVMSYVKWNNCIEFFKFQIDNTKNIWNNYKYQFSKLYEFLNINDNFFDILEKLPYTIDLARPLCLIHGDRHKNNMIKKKGQVYFIDWELSAVGDLAYDIAFHIHQMKYSDSDLKYFIKKLESELPKELRSAIADTHTYMKFVTVRSVIYYVKIISENPYSKSALDKFYIRLKKLKEYEEFNINLPDKNELKILLEKEYTKL